MQGTLAAIIRLLGTSGATYSIGLLIHNGSNRRLLLPVPEVTCFGFIRVSDLKEADWLTRELVSASWHGVTLDPSASHESTYRAAACSVAKGRPHDERDRWCVDLHPGEYDIVFRMRVDADYFDPDSHWRLPQLQRRAEAERAEVWMGEMRSNVLRIFHKELF